MPRFSFTASCLSPVRLDVYAADVQNITRSRLKAGLRFISVNDKEAKLSYKLVGGEKVVVDWEDPLPQDIVPQNIMLDILFENDDLAVINKPQGMVTHPAVGNWSGTLVNALLYRRKKEATAETSLNLQADCLEQNSFRSGIVHRLDKDTSGVLITAKNRAAEVFLQNQFKTRRVKKEYIAIVQGKPPNSSGHIKTQILRSRRNRKLFTVSDDPAKGKCAHTIYRCIGIYGPYSLLRIKLKTGRTHQIRVHLKHLGCPIVGDSLYGKKDKLFSEASLMLHARSLGLRLPNAEDADAFFTFRAPVPLRFKKMLQCLHQYYKSADGQDCLP